MIKKIVAVTALLALAFGLILIFRPTPKKRSGPYLFEFSELPKGELARSGDQIVKPEDIHGPMFSGLLEEQREIFIALVYKQFVENKGVSEIIFSFEKPRRSVKSILNQYGLSSTLETNPQFKPGADGVATVEGQTILPTQIDRKNLIAAAFDTKLFHFYLGSIEQILKERVLLQAAEAKKLKVQDFITQEVLKGAESADDRDKRINYYTEKYLLKLPITVNLTPPNWVPELKLDWTPHAGNPNAEVRVIAFIDGLSDASLKLIEALASLRKEFPQAFVGIRPTFPPQDEYQRLIAEASLCVWTLKPASYWSFLENLKTLERVTLEEDLYKAGEKSGVSAETLKACVVNRQHRKVIDYHLEYAKFIGIEGTPVTFIDGEVLAGPVSYPELQKILRRKLELTDAGIW